MKVLAIDTSTAVMGISLIEGDKVIAEFITNLKKNHSVRLMPAIDNIFKEVGWRPSDISLISVAKGPGSYTGVRIGVTTAKTMSWVLNVPLIGVSTLEVMAYENNHFNGLFSPIIDARRGQVYTGLYKRNNSILTNIETDKIILLDNWLDILTGYNENVLFIGDDIAIHKGRIVERLGDKALFATQFANIPRPSVLGIIAKGKYELGHHDNIFDFAPAYLQITEAESKWLEKQKLT